LLSSSQLCVDETATAITLNDEGKDLIRLGTQVTKDFMASCMERRVQKHMTTQRKRKLLG